jgi:hypothetical protein
VLLLPDWAPPWPEGLVAKLPVPEGSFTRRAGLLWTRASLFIRLVQAFLEAAEWHSRAVQRSHLIVSAEKSAQSPLTNRRFR